MVTAFQKKVELFAVQSVGETGCIRPRSQFVLCGPADELQDTSVVDGSIFQKDGKGYSDASSVPCMRSVTRRLFTLPSVTDHFAPIA